MARYLPEPGAIVWLDFERVRGKEIGNVGPVLVLTGRTYNRRTSLLTCCPFSTCIHGAPTEVVAESLDSPGVVASNAARK